VGKRKKETNNWKWETREKREKAKKKAKENKKAKPSS